MTKLELTISASMDMDMDMEMDMHIDIVEYNDQTAQILGLPLPSPTPTTTPTAKPIPIPISEVLADSQQLRLLQQSIQKIARTSKSKSNNTTSSTATSSTATKAKSASTEQPHSSSISISSSFQTLNLVFLAPDPASTPESEQLLITADRSPLTGVFQSPMHAFHTAGHFHICCFTQLQQLQPLQQSQQPSRDNNDNATTITIIQLVALEYSREHRATLLQQEFESWLVDQIMEKAVIATTIDGTVVYWNRFATALYGYHKQEAMGQEIRDLISTNMSRQQGNEMMARMVEGEHFSTMYKAARKDGTDFMAHTTTTPILDGNNGQVQFMVGVSADYSQLHTVMNKLEQLNANLEKEVVARTEQLLAKEKRLRMIGAAMKQSDTGVIITNNQYNITWCNEAVSRMLGLRQQVILGMKPWELPLQKESKASGSNTHTNTNNNNNAAEDAISVASSQDSNAHARDSRQKTSSLETFFMQEKAYNEQENSNANANVRREDDDDSDDNDDAVNAILREVGASISFSRNNSQTNLTGMDSTTTDATTANTAAATATAMDNTCTTQTTNTTTTTTQPQTTPPEPRPSIPAVCFKLDSPVPLHIMIGVQAMPLDRTFLRLTPKKSASARSSSYSAADMQVLRAGAGGGAGAGVGVGVGIPPVQSTTSTSTSTSSTSQSTTRTRPKEQGHFSYYNDAAKEAAGAPETPSNITKPDNETSSSLKFMITLRDITAERKAEEAQLIAERASAANEAKTQMMQMLSHELRTPLQGIMGVASTSMMDIEDAEGTTNTGNNIIDNNSNDHQALSSPTSSGKDTSTGIKGTMYDSLSTILASSRLLLTLINNTLDTRKINADMMQKIELGTVSIMACIRDSFQYCGPFATINEAILELRTTNGTSLNLPQILNSSNSSSDLMSDLIKKKYNVVGNRLRLEQVIVNLLR